MGKLTTSVDGLDLDLFLDGLIVKLRSTEPPRGGLGTVRIQWVKDVCVLGSALRGTWSRFNVKRYAAEFGLTVAEMMAVADDIDAVIDEVGELLERLSR